MRLKHGLEESAIDWPSAANYQRVSHQKSTKNPLIEAEKLKKV